MPTLAEYGRDASDLSMLKQRVITALVLLALLLPTLFAPPAWPFALLTLARIRRGRLGVGAPERRRRRSAIGARRCARRRLRRCALGRLGRRARRRRAWWIATLVWVLGGAWLLRGGAVGLAAAAAGPARRASAWSLLWTAWLALATPRRSGINFILSVFCLVWAADIAAYFGGRAFGKRKLAPSISPGKSWEGVWSGMVGALVLAAVWLLVERRVAVDSAEPLRAAARALRRRRRWRWLVVFLAAMSVVGDLFESLVKRSAGAKDSSRLLPGHGGVLDRIDALLPVFPIGAGAESSARDGAVARPSRVSRVCILGATGSVGTSTLDVIARHPERFEVVRADGAAAASTTLFAAMRALAAALCRGADRRGAARALRERLRDAGHRHRGRWPAPQALCELAAHPDVDAVMAAIVGAAGLAPCLAAARAGKRLLLANKEALVVGGALFMRGGARRRRDAAADRQRALGDLPVPARRPRAPGRERIDHIVLTASGGPFRSRDPATLRHVTPDEACAHPNWVMGRKISVDSATMMNKALEVIEARWLFDLAPEQIRVVIHPQSIVHSMVVCRDDSVLAQLGTPDMRVPIAYGLSFPERIESGAGALDFDDARRADLRGARPRALPGPAPGVGRAARRRTAAPRC